MKTEYSAADIERARQWYLDHKVHVDRLLLVPGRDHPMSGSDISRPELWKPGGWRWFFALLRRAA